MGSQDVYGYEHKVSIAINSDICILASVLLLRKILFLWGNNMCLFFLSTVSALFAKLCLFNRIIC